MEVVALIIPFIALAILSVMIDKLTLVIEGIMNKIPGFPDRFEWWAAYSIVAIISFIICWQGSFSLFIYLGIHFKYAWEGWLMTALVISGGSSFVRSNFVMIESIPTVLSGVTATVANFVAKGKSNKEQNNVDNNYDNYPEAIEYPEAIDYSEAMNYPEAVESIDANQYYDLKDSTEDTNNPKQ